MKHGQVQYKEALLENDYIFADSLGFKEKREVCGKCEACGRITKSSNQIIKLKSSLNFDNIDKRKNFTSLSDKNNTNINKKHNYKNDGNSGDGKNNAGKIKKNKFYCGSTCHIKSLFYHNTLHYESNTKQIIEHFLKKNQDINSENYKEHIMQILRDIRLRLILHLFKRYRFLTSVDYSTEKLTEKLKIGKVYGFVTLF
jgi:hypothetical protein